MSVLGSGRTVVAFQASIYAESSELVSPIMGNSQRFKVFENSENCPRRRGG
jgi:hypothetical protein